MREVGAGAVHLPMDGFHLAGAELTRLGLRACKGAPQTFDGAGFVALLRRLRNPEPEVVVYAPAFDRALEEPIADAIPIGPLTRLVVVEGNYLLLDEEPWAAVRGLLDEAWFVECDDRHRVERLVARHATFGKSSDEARRWALGSDQHNADLITPTRSRADLTVRAG